MNVTIVSTNMLVLGTVMKNFPKKFGAIKNLESKFNPFRQLHDLTRSFLKLSDGVKFNLFVNPLQDVIWKNIFSQFLICRII